MTDNVLLKANALLEAWTALYKELSDGGDIRLHSDGSVSFGARTFKVQSAMNKAGQDLVRAINDEL